jgi:hypothetical protein
VTDEETWISFMNIDTTKQSKHWMHTHSQNEPKKFIQSFSARKAMNGNCSLGQEMSTCGGIHGTRHHNNITGAT